MITFSLTLIVAATVALFCWYAVWWISTWIWAAFRRLRWSWRASTAEIWRYSKYLQYAFFLMLAYLLARQTTPQDFVQQWDPAIDATFMVPLVGACYAFVIEALPMARRIDQQIASVGTPA